MNTYECMDYMSVDVCMDGVRWLAGWLAGCDLCMSTLKTKIKEPIHSISLSGSHLL